MHPESKCQFKTKQEKVTNRTGVHHLNLLVKTICNEVLLVKFCNDKTLNAFICQSNMSLRSFDWIKFAPGSDIKSCPEAQCNFQLHGFKGDEVLQPDTLYYDAS